MELVYPACNVAQRMTLRMFADWEVSGRENVPAEGPLIIVANHQSNFDPPLLGASLPRRIRFLAKDGIFRGHIVSWFLRSYGSFPVNREGADIRAYRWMLKQLQLGQAMVIFPEGTRSPGSMREAMPGVVQLALKSQVPLLPIGITGTERIGSVLRVFNPTGRLRLNIGSVFHLPPAKGRVTADELGSLTGLIMRRIADLLPESYHGVYRAQPEPTAAK